MQTRFKPIFCALMAYFFMVSSVYANSPNILQINTPKTLSAAYVEGEVVVKYRKERIDLQSNSESARIFATAKSLEKKGEIKNQNVELLKIKDGKSVGQKIAELGADPRVEYVEPNYRRNITEITTNDSLRSVLWGLDNTGQVANGVTGTSDADIDAPEAWAVSEGNPVTVAVIDTGVDYTHPDLTANMWDGTSCKDENGNALGACIYGYDFAANDKNPAPVDTEEAYYHGTHVAGTIGAIKNNSQGILGVAPNVKIMALKFGFDSISEAGAIDFAIQNGAKVINASYGGEGFSQTEYDAIEDFKNAGGIFVAAAGNGGEDNIGDNNEILHFYPADHTLENVIAVAATDQNDALATFSNYGIASIDIVAPGVNIASTYPGNAYAYANGTSMATPHVAGLTALAIGYKPTLSYSRIRGSVIEGGDFLGALANKTVSGRRINALGTLKAASLDHIEISPNATQNITSNQPITFTALGKDAGNNNIDGLNFSWTGTSLATPGTFISPAAGTYQVKVVCAGVESSTVTVNVTATPDYTPVYRFWNANGTHFYTASEAEKNNVIAKYSRTYRFEGVAYYLNSSNASNSAPLYRVWNTNGTHFYSASWQEVVNATSKWPNRYRYEGVAYYVSLTAADNNPVYRFYNMKNGTHFYTASETEKNNVITKYYRTYRYEGIAYYFGS